MKHRKFNKLIIEGFWKLGKTTLANFLKKELNFSLIIEPDHLNGNRRRTKDVDKWYCQQHRKRHKIFFESRKKKIILDRSILSSAAFLYAIKKELPECKFFLKEFVSKFKSSSRRPIIIYLYVKKCIKPINQNLLDRRVRKLIESEEFINRYDEFYRNILPFEYGFTPLCIKGNKKQQLKKVTEIAKNIIKAIKNNRIAQVNVIFYVLKNGEPLFLLLKRSPKRGGFWQGVTGGVKINQTLKEAALSEAREELSLKIKASKLLPTYHSFNFTVKEGYELNEYVFLYKLQGKDVIKISKEHTEFELVTLKKALKLLKYQANKIAFRKAYRLIKKTKSKS